MTADPDLLRVCLEVGQHIYGEFAYLDERFGTPGLRQMQAEMAHLLHIFSVSEQVMIERMGWMAEHASARGVPRWLTEFGCLHLYATLLQHGREREAIAIRRGITPLAAVRRRHVDDANFERLAKLFEARAPAEAARRYRHCGRLLISAVADECSGVVPALDCLTHWMCDEARFSPEWIDAIDQLIEDTRTVSTDCN